MQIEYIKENGVTIAVVTGEEKVVTDAASALELAMSAKKEIGVDRLVIDPGGRGGLFHPQHRHGRGDPAKIYQLSRQGGYLGGLRPVHQQAAEGLYLRIQQGQGLFLRGNEGGGPPEAG